MVEVAMPRDLLQEAGIAPTAPTAANDTGPRDLFAEAGLSPQMQGMAREIALPASAAAKGLIGSLGIFGDIKGLGDQYISEPLLRAFGRDPNVMSDAQKWTLQPATTAEWEDLGKRAGVSDRPDLVPQNEREKIESAAFRGVGASAPLALLGGAPAVASTLLSGAGGGVGSMYGERAGEKFGSPTLGSLAGGLLGGGLGGSLGNVATRATNAATGNFTPLGQAYQSAGVPMKLMGDVSGSPALQALQAFSMKAPGSSGRMAKSAEDVIGAFGKSVEDTASNLGGSTTLEQAGAKVKDEAASWMKNFKSGNTTAWNAVDSAVGNTSPVPLGETKSLLADMKAQAGGNNAAEVFLKSPLAKQMEDIVDEAAQNGGSVPWQTAKALRTRVGEYLENPAMISDAGGAQAKRLWGAFTQDMKSAVANSPNPDAPKLFDLANAYTSKGHDFIENVLTPHVSNSDGASVAKNLLGTAPNGGQVLSQLRSEMPMAADELAGYKLRDMALSNAGQQNAVGSAISPSTFLTDWNKLSPEAKSALYADPAARQKIDALATVGDSIKSTSRQLNNSGTAHNLVLYDILKHIPAGLGAIGGTALGGTETGVLGLLGGETASALTAPLMMRGASYLASNRLLGPMAAARGAGTMFGRSPLLGADIGLLNEPPPPNLLGYQPKQSESRP